MKFSGEISAAATFVLRTLRLFLLKNNIGGTVLVISTRKIKTEIIASDAKRNELAVQSFSLQSYGKSKQRKFSEIIDFFDVVY